MYLLPVLLKDKKFWISILSVWGLIWSILEGILFALQKIGLIENSQLGYAILLLFIISIVIGGILNWPTRSEKKKINETGTIIRLKFGNIWKSKDTKIIAVTRCFSTAVDDTVIDSKSLHGQFIKRNFRNNEEARIRFSTELSNGVGHLYAPGKTIKISGKEDTVFLVALTELDINNHASVSTTDYLLSLSRMWELIKSRNTDSQIICPLLGSDKGRLNRNSSLIFSELLYSFLATHKSGYITNDITFIVYPGDIKNDKVDLYEIKKIFDTICSSENIQRISIDGGAKSI